MDSKGNAARAGVVIRDGEAPQVFITGDRTGGELGCSQDRLADLGAIRLQSLGE